MNILRFILVSLCIGALFIIVIFKKRKKYGITIDLRNLKGIYTNSLDLVVIADSRGCILDVNQIGLLERLSSSPQTVEELFAHIIKKTQGDANIPASLSELKDYKSRELYFEKEDRYYQLIIEPICPIKKIKGYILLFQDISKVKKSERKRIDQNKNLEAANEKLSQYIHMTAELEVEKKKNQILQEVQQTIAEKIKMSVIRMDEILEDNEREDKIRDIKETAEYLREVYKDVRLSINNIAGKEDGR